MSGNTFPRPVWAGIAIKYADGSVLGFELDGYALDGEVTVTHDYGDVEMLGFTDLGRVITPGETFIDVRLSGRAANSARFSDAARDATVYRPAEIEPARKAIES